MDLYNSQKPYREDGWMIEYDDEYRRENNVDYNVVRIVKKMK